MIEPLPELAACPADSQVWSKDTKSCVCKEGFTGADCSQCATGYDSNRNCAACNDGAACDCGANKVGAGAPGRQLVLIRLRGCRVLTPAAPLLQVWSTSASACVCDTNFQGTNCNSCVAGFKGAKCDQTCSAGETCSCEDNKVGSRLLQPPCLPGVLP